MRVRPLESLPISFKLMIMTTLLLLFTVGLYGAMNVQNLGAAYDDSRAEQQEILLQAMTTDARNVTAALGQTAALLVAATAYADLARLVKSMRGADTRLVFISVFDGENAVAADGDAGTALADSRLQDGTGSTDGDRTVEVFSRDGQPHLLRVTIPFREAGVRGRVEAGWSIAALGERNRRVENRVNEAKGEAIINAILVGGMIVLLGVILTVLQSLRISRPIRELTDSVERIARGDLEERVLVEGTDEIGMLGRNFNVMAERLGVLLVETKERATLEKEMEVARLIQDSLLPESRLVDVGFFRFIGYFKSASICGGDWWNFSLISGGRLLLVVGDVTGHGISSAMITAAAKSCCDTLRNVTDGELTVTFLLEELNKTIYEAANRRFVMTFFATIIDPQTRTLTYSNAGHNFPLLFRAHAADEEEEIIPLVTRGNRLGDVMDSRFVEKTISYGPEDILVWYTDGLTEGLGRDGRQFGERRLRRGVSALKDAEADVILDKLISDAQSYFANFERPEDDITLVVGKFPTRSGVG